MSLGLFCVIAGVGWLQSGTQGGTATVSSKSLEKVEELFSEEHVYVIESAGAPGRFLTVNAEDLTILGGDPMAKKAMWLIVPAYKVDSSAAAGTYLIQSAGEGKTSDQLNVW